MRRIVTIDLDSTVYNTSPRDEYMDWNKPRDWREYSMLCIHDELLEGVAALACAMKDAGIEVHWVSGRMDASREMTLKKMEEDSLPVDGLWMDESEDGDHVQAYGSHALYKVDRIQGVIRETGAMHLFHVDDYADVLIELEKVNIPCICVKTPREVLEKSNGRMPLG